MFGLSSYENPNLTYDDFLESHLDQYSNSGLNIPIVQIHDNADINAYQSEAIYINTGFFNDGNKADFLLLDTDDPNQYEVKEGEINYLTPNTKHRLELKGVILENGIAVNEPEEIIIEFTTGESEEVQNLVCLLYTSPSPRDRG